MTYYRKTMRLAVLAALATGATGGASAQSSSVLYGQVDVGLRHVTRLDGAQSTTYLSSSGLSATYFGVKGTETLGAGSQAFYKFEGQFSADDGRLGSIGAGTPLFGREAFVGVSGDWGSLSVGRQYNALNLFFAYNPVWVDGASPIYVAGDNMLLGYRIDNSVVYKKRFGGLGVQLDYALGEQAGDAARGRTFGANVSYDFDGGMVGAGFDNYRAPNGIDGVRNWTGGARVRVADRTSLYAGHIGSIATGDNATRRRLSFAGIQQQATERLLLAGGVYWYRQSACAGICLAGQTVNRGGNGSAIMGFSSGADAGDGRTLTAYARYSLSARTSIYLQVDRYLMRNGAAQDQVYYWSGRQDKSLAVVNQTGVMAGITHSF